MTIYAIKRGEESNERLQSRFKKQFQETRLLKVLRDRKTHKRALTKRLQRIRALKREQFRAERLKNQFYSNM
jgi:ribosomal protein S21